MAYNFSTPLTPVVDPEFDLRGKGGWGGVENH